MGEPSVPTTPVSKAKKRRSIYNAIMVAAIVLIAIGAILGVGSLQGWFDAPASQEAATYDQVEVVAEDKVGNVNIERAGIAYGLENGDRLRDGDIIQTLTGSSVIIRYGDVSEAIPEKCEVAIHIDAETNKVSVEYLNAPSSGEGESSAGEGSSGEADGQERALEGTLAADGTSASGTGGTGQGGGASSAAHVQTCTIQISCASILDNLQNLSAGKDRFVPANGIILATSTVAFNEGDTVFDVLKRACDAAGIQLEYSWTPAYGSYYVEGINHLYEFDCGNESGWRYQVNGWYPNHGCSSYTLKNGDAIQWNYTCTGADQQ